MNKAIKTLSSIILVISILFTAMPSVSPVLAYEAGDPLDFESITTKKPTSTNSPTGSTQTNDISIVQEEISLRKEYEKHFLLSDGTYQVALYSEPVHQLKNGSWVEIDNSLSLQKATDGSEKYVTANGLNDVTFSQTIAEKLISIQHDEHTLSWGVQAFSEDTVNTSLSKNISLQSPAEIVTADISSLSAGDQQTLSSKASSTIIYRNSLRQDVDLEYTVLPNRIKENIILQTPQDIDYYVTTVYADGLSARLLENRRVEFFSSDGEVIFTISSPYMYDSNAELSENITVELISKGNGCYLIKMTPDAGWLTDPARVYPVVIDPVVSTSTTQQNIIDNYVLEGSGVQNNDLDRLYIGKKSGSIARAYIKFATMPTLPSGATISSATMTVRILSGTSTANNASAYQVTGGDWSSSTITWANKPTAATLLASNISHNDRSYYSFSCKTAVASWYAGSTTGKNSNYGIMMRYYNESINDYNSVYSADHPVASERPVLTINYQVPSSSISVLEGGTYTLTAPSGSGTVTWSSSDTSVATVNTSGKVTGVHAGKVTISAAVNGIVQKTYTVYVRISNGVYRIKNSSLNLCLGTYGRLTSPTYTYLFSQQDSGFSQLCQLWKITYLDQGFYIIRPLYKLDMGLHAATADVDISYAGKSDSSSSVHTSFQWTITYTSKGYALKYLGSNGIALKPADGAASPGLGVKVMGYTPSSALCHWDLQKQILAPSGILLYELSTQSTIDLLSSRYIKAGTTKTLEELDFAAYAYSGNPESTERITWRCTSGSSYLTIDQTTGTITARSPGTSVITGSCQYGSFNLYVTVTGTSTTDFTFIHQYDQSFRDDRDLLELIDDAVAFVDQAFEDQFSISFSSSTIPSYRQLAITDNCPLESLDSCHRFDQCGNNCNGSHHKNLYRISNHFYSSTIPSDHIAVFWTDRETDSYCSNGAQWYGLYAIVTNHRPVIHMTYIEDDSETKLACMAANLAHEVAHTFGLEEQDNDISHSGAYGNCVMERYNVDINKEFYLAVKKRQKKLFCPSCEAKINTLLASRS